VPRSRRAAGALFYRLFSLLSDVKMRENAADFRLLSRRAADVIKNDIRERALFLRGIISWMGFKQTAVPFSAGPRAAGESHYSLGKLVGFALTGAVSFSKKPLRFATFAGAVVAALGFLFALYTVLAYAAGNPFPPGWATVMVFLAIFSGIQLVVLGILGEYIGIVFDEVKARPHYVVEESINIEARTR
jgi:dolichol-phosphate mannosyltransferase